MSFVPPKAFAFEDLEVGMERRRMNLVSAGDVTAFAAVSGDTNPVHLDAAYAATTPFETPIAHGMLTAAYVSAMFGSEFPGPGCIYVSQTLNFRAPVRPGDEVETLVQVVEIFPAKKRVRFLCVCSVRGKPVLEGEAILLVPKRTAKA